MVTISPNANLPLTATLSGDRGIREEQSFPGGEHRILIGRSYLSWGAVIAGALSALSILLLSSSLAYACGVPAYSGGGFGVGAFFWSVITSIIAFFIGGCLVSYLAPHSEQRSGLVHGMLAWVLGVLLIGMLTASTTLPFRGAIELDVFRAAAGTAMTHAQLVAAGWAMFISLALGLISACLGGLVGFSGKLNKVESVMKTR